VLSAFENAGYLEALGLQPEGLNIEVAAIDPTASMERVGKPALSELAKTVRNKLSAALARL
jgi:hypothetical protein